MELERLLRGWSEGHFLEFYDSLVVLDAEVVVRQGGELVRGLIVFREVAGVVLDAGPLPYIGIEFLLLNNKAGGVFVHFICLL